MSNATSTSWNSQASQTWRTNAVNWLTRRRIMISLIGFTTLVCVNILIVQAIPNNPFAFTDPQVAVALTAVALGLLIRTWSAGTLKKSREITAVGPYAIVRNPLYIGSFLMMFGFCLLCHDWATLLFVAGPVTWLYWIQVRVEEQRLGELFPGQWSAYMASVPRFLPTKLGSKAFTGWSAGLWFKNREYRAVAASLVSLVAIYGWYLVRQA